MDTLLSEGLVFELFRAEATAGTVATTAIVVALDIIKHRCPHDFTAGKAFAVDAFHLQRVEKAFRAGVIVTIAFRAHAAAQIMAFQYRLIIR